MLDALAVDPQRVHEIAASDGKYGDDVDAAAAAYAEELRAVAEDAAATPVFDLLLLGIGRNGHCASLMPHSPALSDERSVVGVRNSPKPPPTRVSLTMQPLMRSRELWWIASGAEKAKPVRDAVTGADVEDVPAAGPKGMDRTLWFVDQAAAADLPSH
jgi:6-phosphogluconolactonase